MEPARVLKIETTPPNATLLMYGVPNITPGPAITAAQFVDLWQDDPEEQIRIGERLYTIRLVSQEPDYCDAVISLTSGAITQRLFDSKNPRPHPGGDPYRVWTCDDPHFRIHWAGDLDRDGQLDMVVTFSEKYSYHPRQLLLSSAARPPDLVAEVARYERFSQ
jgi:hypothetical protein